MTPLPASVRGEEVARADLVVVGAGPAGLAAAVAAATAGADVTVLDENPDVGGQIFRQPPPTIESTAEIAGAQARDYAAGKRLIARAKGLPIRFLQGAEVWGIFDGRLVAYVHEAESRTVWAERLILATGAFDRPLPFPGWTLPGVVTAGGLQVLLKSQALLPARRVLVAGTGPLLLVVATQLHAAGAEVVAVVEANRFRPSCVSLPALLNEPTLLFDGARYLVGLRRAGIPYLTGHAVVRATGSERRLARVETTTVDPSWRPIAGTKRAWDVDTLCVGYGFLPSTELAVQAGARLEYREELGAWSAIRDAQMRSTVEGVFLVGDGAYIAGSSVAMLEGTIAGSVAAGELGYPVERSERERAEARLTRFRRFRHGMDTLFPYRPGLLERLDPDTIVCRCEEVRAGTIEEALTAGASKVNQVKAWTRTGMGMCQGRLCHATVAQMVANATGSSVPEAGRYTGRPPAKPVRIGALIALSDGGCPAARTDTTPKGDRHDG